MVWMQVQLEIYIMSDIWILSKLHEAFRWVQFERISKYDK